MIKISYFIYKKSTIKVNFITKVTQRNKFLWRQVFIINIKTKKIHFHQKVTFGKIR